MEESRAPALDGEQSPGPGLRHDTSAPIRPWLSQLHRAAASRGLLPDGPQTLCAPARYRIRCCPAGALGAHGGGGV